MNDGQAKMTPVGIALTLPLGFFPPVFPPQILKTRTIQMSDVDFTLKTLSADGLWFEWYFSKYLVPRLIAVRRVFHVPKPHFCLTLAKNNSIVKASGVRSHRMINEDSARIDKWLFTSFIYDVPYL